MFSWESLYSVKVGGVAPHVSELSEALARMGHEVHVFTRRGDFDYYDEINGVHYQRVDHDPTGDIVHQMDTMCDAMVDRFEAVQRIFGRFDVIHGHDWHPVNAIVRIKKSHSIPLIFTVHSTEWGRNGNSYPHSPVSREISHREWLGGYESARVIVTTEQMKNELMMLYSIPGEKIEIIPNGIVIGKLRRSLDAGRVKERYGIHPLAPVILFCGRMCYQKGPDLLVRAIPDVLRERWDAKFVFVGDGDMKWECERLARELGVEHACRFLGYVPSSTKEDLMNACDIICLPSRNEPFGVVVLEAWDAGKPVVATEAVTIIKNFEDGLLAYIQPESLAWCIKRMLNNPDEMKKLSAAARARLEHDFSWDKIAEMTVRVYEDVLDQRDNPDACPSGRSVSRLRQSIDAGGIIDRAGSCCP